MTNYSNLTFFMQLFAPSYTVERLHSFPRDQQVGKLSEHPRKLLGHIQAAPFTVRSNFVIR